MGLINFQDLPDHARLWIFAAERSFTEKELSFIKSQMDQFVQQWVAHKQELKAGWELRYDRFILVGVDESLTPVSGCSIDNLIHNLKRLQEQLDTQIVNTHDRVYFRDVSNHIQCVERPKFKELVEIGSVTADTVVFNNTIQTVRELRQGLWEIPMSKSWHWQAFSKYLTALPNQ